ncbi:MAG TPA: DUF4440 domain-containing protein [Cyclobacteriaceae bacterium]|nr:DUF4440 domain-containing protein [Cyclobacteriaceae bacterium]
MKQLILTVLSVVIIGACCAQEFTNPHLQSLVNTERAFAKLAKEKNTRTAFLTYLADESVTFGGGKPQNGKDQYSNRPEDESLLIWEPIYSDISASGDFGFNTGPWEFRGNRKDQEAVAYGDFVSVWKKQADGNWKLVIDLGVVHPKPKSSDTLKTTAMPLTQITSNINSKDSFIKVEKDFLMAFAKLKSPAYESLLSEEARFFRTGVEPLTNSSDIHKLLVDQDREIEYTLIDGDVASSGDLGYVYGTVLIKGDNRISNGNYQRIWKKENGSWKIVIDVISSN